jgi:hypothetical protein
MVSLIQPMDAQVEIVDEKGRPTLYFQRLLQKLSVGTGLSVNNGVVNFAAMAAKTILANKTVGTASPTACTLSDILDFIGSAAQGDILFRGATTWQRLAAGTAGNLLQTNGAGADPTWVSPPAGGSGAAMWNWAFCGIPAPAGITGSTTATLGAGTVTAALVKASIGNWYWLNSGQSGRTWTIDLGSAEVISGILNFQDIIATQGTWQPQYSDDNITYTNIGATSTWNAVMNTWTFTNSTAHRYWRLTQTSGTTSNASWQQGTMLRHGAA